MKFVLMIAIMAMIVLGMALPVRAAFSSSSSSKTHQRKTTNRPFQSLSQSNVMTVNYLESLSAPELLTSEQPTTSVQDIQEDMEDATPEIVEHLVNGISPSPTPKEKTAEEKALEEAKQRLLLKAQLEYTRKSTIQKQNAEKSSAQEQIQRALLAARLEREVIDRAAKQAAERAAEHAATKELQQRALLQTKLQMDVLAREAAIAKQKAMAEWNQRLLLEARLVRESTERAIAAEILAKEVARLEAIMKARSQPKSEKEERALAEKYAAMPLDVRAFNILLDLYMIELTPDPDDANYDSSKDHLFYEEKAL